MQHISEMGRLFKLAGIRHVVLCPGSRNAPLLDLFTSDDEFIPHSIVDERSAGYVALGMARQLGDPVGVVTTSGTAVLNLAPAVAEASLQKIPLVLITADRPAEPMGIFNNQRILQQSPFAPNCLEFMEFPPEFPTLAALEEMLEELAGFLAPLHEPGRGPRHLNLVLREPLYGELPSPVLNISLPEAVPAGPGEWRFPSHGQKILVLAGAGKYDDRVANLLGELALRLELAVVAENLANLAGADFISSPEILLAACDEELPEELLPHVVLSFGGQVVSKRLKRLLQARENILYREIGSDPVAYLSAFLEENRDLPERKNSYLESWIKVRARAEALRHEKLRELPYGNLLAIYRSLEKAPGAAVVHLGNSATVRYAQVLPLRDDLEYYSNRGTSGIDGCVSTAVGSAMVSTRPHLLLVGDLSFVYDSNALWNRHFPSNLKIVVLNDGGGGIFRLLEGPSRKAYFEEYSVTAHPVSPALLAESFGRGSRVAGGNRDLETALDELLSGGSGLQVLDVHTMDSENSRIFAAYMDFKSAD